MQKDQEILGIILEFEKNMVKNYAISLTEAGNDKLTSSLLEQFQEVLQMQKEVFNFMNEQGWYKLENATETKITQEEKKNQKITY